MKFSQEDEERMRTVASSSSSRLEKIVLQGNDSIIFEVDKALAEALLLSKVPGNILAKVIEYCKHVVFVTELVNDDKETLFRVLVVGDYLNIHSLLSLACEDVSYMIKHKDPEYIHRIFNITPDFSLEEEEKMRKENPRASN
ncbi:hypothetical protein M9H77_13390 [Catharanthus roseus]|uniref:Uncharacterized protein n=1 Tax=Catharanthus roseus TaxID=4058 RepID=A0ACC0BKC3_CATRO|nr:hypothetical protein M9H77_13390 [Catharanthus roseus]